jgi:hypothetical protein
VVLSPTTSRKRAKFSRRAAAGVPGAEDADALPCGLDDLGVGPGAGDHRLIPEIVVDDVALAAALVAFPAYEGLTFIT